jgi:hypothetical protein
MSVDFEQTKRLWVPEDNLFINNAVKTSKSKSLIFSDHLCVGLFVQYFIVMLFILCTAHLFKFNFCGVNTYYTVPLLFLPRVISLIRGPLSLMSTIEEMIERKSRGSILESREYGHRYPSHWPRRTLYPQNLALTLPTSGGHSVSIVHLRTQTPEFVVFVLFVISLILQPLNFYLCESSALNAD